MSPRRSRWFIGVVAACVLAAGVAAVAVLLLTRGGDDPGGAQEPTEAALLPDADFFSVLRPGGGAGPAVVDRLNAKVGDFGPQPIPGTVRHLAEADTLNGTVEIYSWSGVDRRGILMHCDMQISANGSSAGCGPAEPGQPAIGHGSSGGGIPGDAMSRDLSLSNAPAGAAWLVVETQLGNRIVANVVNGVSYVEWPGDAGIPVTVRVLDIETKEIWTTRINVG